MKTCLKCGASKPTEAFSKRALSLDGLAKWCKTCTNEYNKAYYAKNQEQIKKQNNEYKIKNQDKIKQYWVKNKDKFIAMNKVWCEANQGHLTAYNQQEHIKERRREYAKKYYHLDPIKYRKRARQYKAENPQKVKDARQKHYKTDPGKYRHLANIRRAARIQRTPCWLTDDDKVLIQRKYALAQKKTETTGEMWVVDHILPLRGEFVSGLHVPSNLRVIKATTNARKSNKYVPV